LHPLAEGAFREIDTHEIRGIHLIFLINLIIIHRL
jgi:hypothetical protein